MRTITCPSCGKTFDVDEAAAGAAAACPSCGACGSCGTSLRKIPLPLSARIARVGVLVLASLGLGLPPGPLSIFVYGGHVGDGSFDYGTLVYRQLDARGWTAYAYDVFHRYGGN